MREHDAGTPTEDFLAGAFLVGEVFLAEVFFGLVLVHILFTFSAYFFPVHFLPKQSNIRPIDVECYFFRSIGKHRGKIHFSFETGDPLSFFSFGNKLIQ